MLKRKFAALLVTVVLFIGVSVPYVAKSAGTDGEAGLITEDVAKEPKKKGNAFARAVKAPFKAFSRLFGGNKDDSKPRRITKKDAEKFVSAGAYRVDDARSPAPSPLLAAANSDNAAEELTREGRALLTSGRASEAIRLLSRAASLKPSLAEAHHFLGVAYSSKGLHDLSRSSFEQAVRLAPNDLRTLNDYGYALYMAGGYKDAVKFLKRAAKIAPANQRIWNNLALVQCRMGKYDDAYKSFAHASGEYQGRLNIAGVLMQSARVEDAIKHYEAALRVSPGSAVVLKQLVKLYERTGQSHKAEAARRALTAPDGKTEALAGGIE